MELVCPAGNLPALKRAVDEGADAVYFGFQNTTNARQFAGLNFTDKRAREGIDYAHARGKRVFCAINTYPQPDGWAMWTRAVDQAADLGVDALIMADMGLLDYAARRHPDLARHLSVQARPPATRRCASITTSSASSAPCCPGCSPSPRCATWPSRAPWSWRYSPSAACASWPRGAATCRRISPVNRPTPAASARRRPMCAGRRPRRAWSHA